MNHCPDAHTNEDVGKHLFEGAHNLVFCIYQPVLYRQIRGLDVHTALGPTDEFLHVVFHVKLFNNRTAGNRNHQPQHHIYDSDLRAENTHEQDETSQIHHGRGNEEREGHAQGQPRAGKANEQRDGGAGTEWRHSAKQSGNEIGPQAVKPAQNPLAPLRREKALDIGNHKNQETQQNRDLDDVIKEKQQASSPAGGGVQPQGRQSPANDAVQPLHTQNLVLEKSPDGSQYIHIGTPFHIDK